MIKVIKILVIYDHGFNNHCYYDQGYTDFGYILSRF